MWFIDVCKLEVEFHLNFWNVFIWMRNKNCKAQTQGKVRSLKNLQILFYPKIMAGVEYLIQTSVFHFYKNLVFITEIFIEYPLYCCFGSPPLNENDVLRRILEDLQYFLLDCHIYKYIQRHNSQPDRAE